MTMTYLLAGNGLLVAILGYALLRSRKHSQALQRQLEEEKRSKNEALALVKEQSQSEEDFSPGIFSRQHFEVKLSENLQQSARYKLTLGVMYVGIDDFNLVCNALGHELLEDLVSETAERLLQCVRQVDAICYMGKGVFAVMLTQLLKPETAVVVAQRVLQAMHANFKIESHDVLITTSIGVSTYPEDGQDITMLLDRAEFAMNAAKEQGGQSYRFYQEKMQAESRRELALVTSLSRDSIYEELATYYQPIVNVIDQSVFCMDVLLCWHQPQVGLLGAEELFVYAERQRKWNDISEWLLKNACRQFLEWRQLGFSPAMLGVSLSIKQIESSQFVYRLSHVLKELNFDPKCLLIEIKESHGQVSFDVLEKSFNMLQYLGVRMAIGDFGVNSLSLRYLKQFNIQYLKLSPNFISNVAENPQAKRLIESVLLFAKNMSMSVIIQGVSQEQQAVLLKEMGCELMQGHVLCDPIAEREVVGKMVAPTS